MDERIVIERFCQVMAETIGVNLKSGKNAEYGIFPYGYQGEIANNLLRQKFGITPKYIIDNKWSKFNSNIVPLDTAAEIDNENLTVFIASDRNEIYDEIRDSIYSNISKGAVVDLFPMVNTDNDGKVEAVRLLAKHFNTIKMNGSVAEAGVREGAFARYINKYFPTKKIYLFDTFEGFNNEQVKKNMVDEEKVFEVNMDYRGYHHELRGGNITYALSGEYCY